MSSEKEKQGIKDLLVQLDLNELVSLTDTVTNRVVSAENRREAIQAILLYSITASQLLKRKKVKREHLYKYLAEQGYIAPISSDKPFLCRKILKLWGSPDKLELCDTDEMSCLVANRQNTKNEQAISSTSSIHPVDTEVLVTEGQNLAENFIPWFYGLLNSVVSGATVVTGANNDDSWGPHHFWHDAKCSVIMISSSYEEDECLGAVGVSNKLAEVVSSEKLLLNVNHSSIKGDMDIYGLGKIIAGGTVHRVGQCLGIFEQSFGLIRDPLTDNNWKIKFTNLKLKSQGQNQGSQMAAAGDGLKALGQY